MISTVNLSYYDTSNKEFLQTRATVVDDSDASVDYIPYNATKHLAPDKSLWPAHTHPVFNGSGWDMVADYRGIKYYHMLTQEEKEYGLGESPDVGHYTTVAPNAPGTEWSPLLKQWVVTVESTRIQKLAKLKATYEQQMSRKVNTGLKVRLAGSSSFVDLIIGFQSDDERMRLSSLSAMAALYPSQKEFVYRMFDGRTAILSANDVKVANQIQHMNFIQTNMRYTELTTQVGLATTIDEINNIVW